MPSVPASSQNSRMEPGRASSSTRAAAISRSPSLSRWCPKPPILKSSGPMGSRFPPPSSRRAPSQPCHPVSSSIGESKGIIPFRWPGWEGNPFPYRHPNASNCAGSSAPEEIRAPIAVWHGTQDRNFSCAGAAGFAARIPDPGRIAHIEIFSKYFFLHYPCDFAFCIPGQRIRLGPDWEKGQDFKRA